MLSHASVHVLLLAEHCCEAAQQVLPSLPHGILPARTQSPQLTFVGGSARCRGLHPPDTVRSCRRAVDACPQRWLRVCGDADVGLLHVNKVTMRETVIRPPH